MALESFQKGLHRETPKLVLGQVVVFSDKKGGSRHGRHRHNRRSRQNRHGRPGCLLAPYFVEQPKEGKVLSRTAKTVKTAKTVMKANPP